MASFAAPSCSVISGPIDQNSAAANTKTTGHNLQVITDQSGNIVVIFKPYIGSVYDLTTLHETGMLDVLDPKHLAADKDSWRQV